MVVRGAVTGRAVWQNQYLVWPGVWYLGFPEGYDGADVASVQFVTYFVLWTYLIPLSLFVSIELCRIAQLLFMNADETMIGTVDGKNVYMSCNNSNLNEDLGRIEHIFSDKTGTLTQNLMSLRGWYIDGSMYKETEVAPASSGEPEEESSAVGDPAPAVDPARPAGILARTIRLLADGVIKRDRDRVSAERLRFVMRAVALCNTVVPSTKPSEVAGKPPTLLYEADSPDELALLEAMQANGVELRERSQTGVKLAIARSNFAAPEPTRWVGRAVPVGDGRLERPAGPRVFVRSQAHVGDCEASRHAGCTHLCHHQRR